MGQAAALYGGQGCGTLGMNAIYRIGGLHLESEVPLQLPMAPRADPIGAIRYGTTPAALAGCTVKKLLCEASAQEFLLRIPEVASFWVRAGTQIVVDVAAGATQSDVNAYLLSYAFGALCQQRGLVVLHATALAINGCALLLLGSPGSGKSTLAAELAVRGHAVLCDDVCVITADANAMRVQPLSNRLGVWADALQHFRWQRQAPRWLSSIKKYVVDFAPACDSPLPVGYVVFLHEQRAPQPAFSWEELRPAAALAATLEQTLLPFVAAASGQQAEQFQRCTQLLEHATVYDLGRHRALANVPQAARALQQLIMEQSPRCF